MFILLLLFCLCVNVDAQSIDREIEALREQIKLRESQLLQAAPEDFTTFADFLQQPDTGLVRLLPREKYEHKLGVSGGGAYYSFTRLDHAYGYGSDIELSQNNFSVGFAGADYGFIVMLGDIPLEEVTLEDAGVQYLATFKPPRAEQEAREQHRRGRETGFEVGKYTYKSRLPALVNNTYVLRSVNYGTSDVLIALRVVRRDFDGSRVMLWKLLKRFPAPQFGENA